MATCGDCCNFAKCFNRYERPINVDHEICERYVKHTKAFSNSIKHSDLEHPKRYVHGSVECFDMLEAALSPREVIGFYKGCILKYVWREQDKGGWYDLQKAEVYARRLNEFCARIGLSGDVPHDVSIGCARDTD